MMSGSEHAHCSSKAVNASVLGAGVLSSFAAPGVVYCAEKVAPEKMAGFKRMFAKHFVEPHIHTFRLMSKGLRHSHQRYDERKIEQERARGIPVKKEDSGKPADIKQESIAIADAWVTGMIAAGSAYAANFAALKLFNHIPGVDNNAGHLSRFDTATSLLGMAAMPTVLAGFSENANHAISRLLRKFGMSKQDAENVSVPAVYVQFPELVGVAATLMLAHYTNGKSK